MNWRNVRLIYAREIRDQLRDRRTLFMIAVLPILLYPLLGMSFLQLMQFLRKSEPKVLVIGSQQLAASDDLPPLFKDGHFSPELFDDSTTVGRMNVQFIDDTVIDNKVEGAASEQPDGNAGTTNRSPLDAAQQALKAGDIQVVLYFPPDFGKRMAEMRDEIQAVGQKTTPREDGPENPSAAASGTMPEPEILFNSSRDKSSYAHIQVLDLLNAWKSQIVRANLVASRVPADAARPFELKRHDVAERGQQQSLMWSKVLPFFMFLWTLTGAFYPAVDLCAGEKERGTLETLLSGPALRSEIVWGKLLTVMTFSVATVLLNMASVGFTLQYSLAQYHTMLGADMGHGLELPPLRAVLWLLAAIVPMSALFSALCLACAAFARSSKEGQYYLVPLLLITTPLMLLPMGPGVELDLGNSLIPITGVVLLLKSLVQENYTEALRYALPVSLVTLVCCRLAIRWAVYQFNQESVLFRESERLDLRRWVVHLVRDRQETPSLPEAFFCVAIIYVIQFFTGLAVSANMPASPNFNFLVLLLFISQVVCIALPALMMTLVLTSRPLKTLLLEHGPRASACVAAVLLAVVLHPVGFQLVHWIRELYPVQEQVLDSGKRLTQMLQSAPYAWMPFVLLAVLPAICEELAFRGFVLSGLRHLGNKWWAIGLSAIFFGLAHPVIQQSIGAVALGLVIGYLAVQTGSLVPGMLFHMTYNAVMFAAMRIPELAEHHPGLSSIYRQPTPDQLVYIWPIVLMSGLLAAGLLAWFHRLPFQATKEEQLSDIRALQSQHPLAGGATD